MTAALQAIEGHLATDDAVLNGTSVAEYNLKLNYNGRITTTS